MAELGKKGGIKLPNKSHFKVNELCEILGITPKMLKDWETKFDDVSPMTSSSGQKLYSHKDAELLVAIKNLLQKDKLSAKEAKSRLRSSERGYKTKSPVVKQSSEKSSEKLPEEPQETPSEKSEEKPISEGVQKHSSESASVDFDTEAYLQAYQTLRGILELTESIQGRHQWS